MGLEHKRVAYSDIIGSSAGTYVLFHMKATRYCIISSALQNNVTNEHCFQGKNFSWRSLNKTTSHNNTTLMQLAFCKSGRGLIDSNAWVCCARSSVHFHS